MKQLIANNPMIGMSVIVRFIKGIKYLKVTPVHMIPLIEKGLKQQAGDLVKTEVKNGWIKIIKTGKSNEQLEKVTNKLKENIPEELKEEDILNKEAEFMQKAGFIVRMEEI